jgi:hypothetical protein
VSVARNALRGDGTTGITRVKDGGLRRREELSEQSLRHGLVLLRIQKKVSGHGAKASPKGGNVIYAEHLDH